MAKYLTEFIGAFFLVLTIGWGILLAKAIAVYVVGKILIRIALRLVTGPHANQATPPAGVAGVGMAGVGRNCARLFLTAFLLALPVAAQEESAGDEEAIQEAAAEENEGAKKKPHKAGYEKSCDTHHPTTKSLGETNVFEETGP